MKFKYLLFALLLPLCFVACKKDDNNPTSTKEDESTLKTTKSAFSVSATKQVAFTLGNVQYNVGTKKWQVASKQYECVGKDLNEKHTGLIDLFGWNSVNMPDSMGTTTASYAKDFEDWGKKFGKEFFTLTNEEWDYLIHTRADADKKYGTASVDGINGLVLLPDTWAQPSSVTFQCGVSPSMSNSTKTFAPLNKYSAADWSVLESAGAVFLPAAGLREDASVRGVGSTGRYWSSTPNTDSKGNNVEAYNLYFYSYVVDIATFNDLYQGYSVRLVKKY